jgi:hypothetical protein
MNRLNTAVVPDGAIRTDDEVGGLVFEAKHQEGYEDVFALEGRGGGGSCGGGGGGCGSIMPFYYSLVTL